MYASAWLKCFEPAAFLAALLNSQPMGFYAPSQLIQDARRHGVEVRPADVTVSDWECTLEAVAAQSDTEASPQPPSHSPSHPPFQPATQPAVRLGLRMVRGLGHDAGARIVAARCQHAFNDTADLAARAQVDAGTLRVLATAAALATLAGHRRQALWQAAGCRASCSTISPSGSAVMR